MKKYWYQLLLVSLMLPLFSACGSFMEGMAYGMGNYGGYGVGGYGTGVQNAYMNPYATPIGVLPYHLRPDVYLSNALQQFDTKMRSDFKQMEESTARVKAEIEARAAEAVKNGYVAAPVTNSTQSSSTGSSGRSDSRVSEKRESSIQYGYKDCPQCLGSGKCKICNGTGLQEKGFGVGHIPCGACTNHNGKCTWCNGDGKRYGRL